MKFNILTIGLLVSALSFTTPTVQAQNNSPPESAPIIDKAGEQAALDAGKSFAKGATNVASWDVAPYVTYFPNKVHAATFGGGVYVQYKIKGSENFSAGIGLDYLGRLTMPSGSVTAKLPIDVGRYIGFSTNKIVITPFAIAGIATPLSGAGGDNLGVAGLAGTGAFIPIPALKIGGRSFQPSFGYAAVKWLNSGIYSGLHHEIFCNVSF